MDKPLPSIASQQGQKHDILSTFLNKTNSISIFDDKLNVEDCLYRPEQSSFNRIFDEQNNNEDTSQMDNPFVTLMASRPEIDLSIPDEDFFKVFDQDKLDHKKTTDEGPSMTTNSSNSPHENKSTFLGKKTIFTSKRQAHTYQREIKLIQNRMSAKKCRQKKKDYIDNLEKEVTKYKHLVEEYQNIIAKNQSIEKAFSILSQKEKEVLSERQFTEEQIISIRNEYKTAQNWLQEELFIKFVQSLIPLEYKIFYKKFLKMETIETGDNIVTAEKKITKNILM